ncbi:paramyosin [Drosophila madeirensis]|uniref:Paramyosin n=1 Tax=Drosophila madeirensis TaxID=30013 RepID=A0AAU9EZ22_DROMD
MARKKPDSWKKLYFQLIREHYNDQRKVQIIRNQLRRFQAHRARMQTDFQQEAERLRKQMETMDYIRQELDRLERTKHRMTPKKRQQLSALQKKMPVDSLEERLKIMEISELSDSWLPAQPAVERQLVKINADKRAIKRINDKTMVTIEDIRCLETISKFLRKGNCTRIEIRPYVNRGNWLEPTTTAGNPSDVKATIVLDRLHKVGKEKGRTKGRHLTRQQLEVHPRSILLKLTDLMPDMYHYLDRGK